VNIGVVDAVFDSWAGWLPFAIGWSVGWLLLARPRPLTRVASAVAPASMRRSVVVPARDEADVLPILLGSLAPQLRPGDELVVVDDGSSDDTAIVAAEAGATVVPAGPVPHGWLGKPHACSVGATATGNELLVFLDADVRPGADLLDRLTRAVEDAGGGLVSVQPSHVPGSRTEQLSLVANVVALAGSGAFTVAGPPAEPAVAFGPVLAIGRSEYERIGGHAGPGVRDATIEDVALGRRVGRFDLYTGGRAVAFRMHPGGLRDQWRGWVRTLGAGASASSWWATLATAAWIWALAAAPFVTWWAYVASVVQLWVLGRIAGRFSPVVAVVYPLALAFFVAAALRGLAGRVVGQQVAWKGRRVPAG
jgi:4,4'-diaponeurosporenoate glycosyltransferase